MAAAVEYFLNIILLLVITVCVGAVGRNIVLAGWDLILCHGLFAVCGGGGWRWRRRLLGRRAVSRQNEWPNST